MKILLTIIIIIVAFIAFDYLLFDILLAKYNPNLKTYIEMIEDGIIYKARSKIHDKRHH